MHETLYRKEHLLFREAFKSFLSQEIIPFYDQWEKEGIIPKGAWKKMGMHGYLCPWVEKKYGGAGLGLEYSFIITEEMAYAGVYGLMAGLHSDIVAPYIHSFGNKEQKKKWLPGCVSGDIILAVAMTEPDAGSDLSSIRTTAVKDGDNYIINGEKVFISNAILSDLIVVACKTETDESSPYKNISLICVEDGSPGFSRGRNLEKTGWHSQDTGELIFRDCKVPVSNLLGEEGKGFYYMMEKLQQERLISSIMSQAAAEAAVQMTIDYYKKGKGLNQPEIQIDTTGMVEMATDIEIGRTFLNSLIHDHIMGKDIIKKVSMAKWWTSDMANRIISQCMEIYRDYGYLEDYQVGRLFRDVRAHPIYAGTNEIMKRIISRKLGL
ncbi:MAG: acyl-CoA dehydrogenase family protein [Deltaproteobacteria bacterium]|nr:acyl-CoA dehydrogenase family protein [Deltaproteobacteria bacterium]